MQNYNYYKNIQLPSQLGMSDKGNIQTLSKNVGGLISYVQLLIEGSGKASVTGKPLGNKYFYDTGALCQDKDGKQQKRSLYINNVPSGSIPFISSGLGANFKDFKGLIPGTIEKLGELDPISMMVAFTTNGAYPKCRALTLETIDLSNKKSKETKFIADGDIKQMSPCLFPDGTNPITNTKCRETFGGIGFTETEDINIYIGIILMIILFILTYLLVKL
jgi:hypothetical protein